MARLAGACAQPSTCSALSPASTFPKRSHQVEVVRSIAWLARFDVGKVTETIIPAISDIAAEYCFCEQAEDCLPGTSTLYRAQHRTLHN